MQQGRRNNNDANRMNPTGQTTQTFTVQNKHMISSGLQSNVSDDEFSMIINTGGSFGDTILFRMSIKNNYCNSNFKRSVRSFLKGIGLTKKIITTLACTEKLYEHGPILSNIRYKRRKKRIVLNLFVSTIVSFSLCSMCLFFTTVIGLFSTSALFGGVTTTSHTTQVRI